MVHQKLKIKIKQNYQSKNYEKLWKKHYSKCLTKY